jgi:peptidoglycan/LPS O-acetylase OafA/YrhL
VEEILVFFLELILELFGEVLLEGGLAALKDLFDRENRAPQLATFGYLLLGALVGGLFVWGYPQRLTPPSAYRGISLAVAPFAGGAVMEAWGALRRSRGHETTQLATWYGGAAFLFGLALVRFLLVK